MNLKACLFLLLVPLAAAGAGLPEGPVKPCERRAVQAIHDGDLAPIHRREFEHGCIRFVMRNHALIFQLFGGNTDEFLKAIKIHSADYVDSATPVVRRLRE